MTQCKEMHVPDDFGVRFHQCPRKASMPSGYCRTHDPECIKARAAKRPPTKFERELRIILAKQKIERERDAELAELRAYKERTEAALRKLTMLPGKRRWVEESLKALGLWRDKEPAKLVTTYMGKRLAECSREELLAARDVLPNVNFVAGPSGKRLTPIEQDETRFEMLREIDALLAKHKEMQ